MPVGLSECRCDEQSDEVQITNSIWVYRVLGPAVKRFQLASSSTENALVPCSLSSGLSSICGPFEYIDRRALSVCLLLCERLRDYCTHSAP